MGKCTRSCRTTDHEAALADRLCEVVDHSGSLEDIDRSHRATVRFLGRKFLRTHQNQPGQRHRLHRARHRTDIAGMRWFYEYDANLALRHLDLAATGS
jgi:hypothetical protein